MSQSSVNSILTCLDYRSVSESGIFIEILVFISGKSNPYFEYSIQLPAMSLALLRPSLLEFLKRGCTQNKKNSSILRGNLLIGPHASIYFWPLSLASWRSYSKLIQVSLPDAGRGLPKVPRSMAHFVITLVQ